MVGKIGLKFEMNFFVRHSELRDLYDKVAAGERISDTDALRLFESKDLNALGAIAELVCQRKNGNRASYIINRYINYSNYCILSCQFCAFARKKRDADGFQLSIGEIVQKAREALSLGITELHIVGGLHPSLPFSYYVDMLKALSALNETALGSTGDPPVPSGDSPDGTRGTIRAREDGRIANHRHAIPVGGSPTGAGESPAPPVPQPRLQLKCFTAIEILHLAWLAKKSVRDTLLEFKAAGLESLTGGGAEIFRKEIRSQIARGKESAEEYLDVHRTWHQLGGRSTCTMLFGHVESLADRVHHLSLLRQLQDETHGFVGFVPLAYQPDNNLIEVKTAPSGFDSLRTIAASRIYLDNFDHITAYWVGLGLKLAQVALNYGADDLHGTIIEEHIFHMAGAKSPQLQTENEMIKAIREAGRTPVQRNTFYEPIKVWEEIAAPTNSANSGKSKVLEDNLATA